MKVNVFDLVRAGINGSTQTKTVRHGSGSKLITNCITLWPSGWDVGQKGEKIFEYVYVDVSDADPRYLRNFMPVDIYLYRVFCMIAPFAFLQPPTTTTTTTFERRIR